MIASGTSPIAASPGFGDRPHLRGLTVLMCLIVLATFARHGAAQPLRRDDPRIPLEPAPEQDDATLHDVAFLGDRFGIAVGDRGTTWRTSDGGRSWEFRPAGVSASLRSVCLLTDQIGFAAGFEIAPETHIATGVVVGTSDGGRTWRRLDDGRLPALTEVRFFDLEQGCAAGEASAACSSGLWTTSDGGRTWSPVEGSRSDGWSAAAFTDPEHGAVVGSRNRQGTFANGRLLPQRTNESLRGLHDVVMAADGRGWIAGDGGTLLTTEDGGVSWPAPTGVIPEDVRSIQDFLCVAAVGECVWATGSPGSVVWRSLDSGATWIPQPTGEATPIRALGFGTETCGCAVGAFGSIRMTWDGGRTWSTVRGARRRPAFLTIHAHADQLSTSIFAREAGEGGFRGVALFLTRRDIGPEQAKYLLADERLRAAVVDAGGNGAATEWRLPLAQPELDRQREALLKEWSRLHEERLPQVLLGSLVAKIRTWRPEVIVLPEGSPEDAVTALLNEALPLAIAQAADPLRFPEQRMQLGLQPWTVAKVFRRTTNEREATLTIERTDVLPRLGGTVSDIARRAGSRVFDGSRACGEREFYRLASVGRLIPQDGDNQSILGRGFFNGLDLPMGGEARRRQRSLTSFDEAQLAALARHQRNFAAYAEQIVSDPNRVGQLLAQLRESTSPLPAAQAARLLSDLADEYRRQSQWEYAAATFVELVERYPDEPAAKPAMRWLLAYWSSQELLWRHLRSLSAGSPATTVDLEILQTNFTRAAEAAGQAENSAQLAQQIAELPSPVQVRERPGSIRLGNLAAIVDQSGRTLTGSPVPAGVDQMTIEIGRRWEQAWRVARTMEAVAPRVYALPDVQFVVASLLRSRQQLADATEIYRRHFGLDEGLTAWNSTARGEIWTAAPGALSPKPVLLCRRAAAPPVLDGILTDECWVSAEEVRLTEGRALAEENDPTFVGDRQFVTRESRSLSTPSRADPNAIVMLSYDDRYLYLAASVPRSDAAPTDGVQYAGRVHDADLHPYDRLTFAFDVDRDYATWYRFDVDQRGWTRDALWEDVAWNPTWHVAADAQADVWRMEAAIPLTELTPAPPASGAIWAAGVSRIIPTKSVQAWTHPASLDPRGETFGYVRFD